MIASSFRNGKLQWKVNFSQNVQDWELESMTSFMDLIYSLTLDGNGMDMRTRVRNLLHLWKTDVVHLQEMKLTAVTQGLVCSLWRCRYVDEISQDSTGASSGILLMWDKRIFE